MVWLSQFPWSDDFESGVSGWSASAPAGCSLALAASAAFAFEGAGSMRAILTNGGAGSASFTISRTVPMGAAWAGRSVVLTYLVFSSDAGLTWSGAGAATGAGTWAWRTTTVTADGSGGVPVAITVTAPPGSYTAYLDSVRIELAFTATPTPVDAALAFPFAPDGAEPITETWEYPTSVITAREDREGRQCLVARPVRTLRYRVTGLDAAANGRLDSLLWANLKGRWNVPWWCEAAQASAATGDPSTSETIALDNAGLEFQAGGLAMVWRSDQTADVLRITAATSTQVTLFGVGSFTHAAGDWVIPVRSAVLSEEFACQRPGSFVRDCTVSFTSEVATDGTAPPVESEAAFLGYPVLSLPPSRGEDWQDRAALRAQVVGSPAGATVLRRLGKYPAATRSLTYALLDRTAVRRMRRFLASRKGRKAPFWTPTWNTDFRNQLAEPAGGSLLRIDPIGYAASCFPSPAKRFVALVSPGGVIYPLRVASASASSTVETLSVAPSTWPYTLTPGDEMLSYLSFCRLSDDRVEIVYDTPDVAAVRLGFTELAAESEAL